MELLDLLERNSEGLDVSPNDGEVLQRVWTPIAAPLKGTEQTLLLLRNFDFLVLPNPREKNVEGEVRGRGMLRLK